MAVKEHSIGRFYFAWVRTYGPVPLWKPNKVDITEECDPPWRKGKAILFTLTYRHAIILGWWKKQDTDETWFGAKDMFVTPTAIGQWYDGREVPPSANDELPEVQGTG